VLHKSDRGRITLNWAEKSGYPWKVSTR